MDTCKTLISPTISEQISKIISSSQIDIIKDAYSHLYLNNPSETKDLQSFLFENHLPFSYGKLTLHHKKNNHKLEFYFDINLMLETNLTIFYDKIIQIQIDFEITFDPQNETELLLLTLFNTAHYCYFFKEEYLLNVINRTSDLYDEIRKIIGVKIFEAVNK